MVSESLVFWHGGRSINGSVQIRPGSVENRQHGPGFYLTTSLARARTYARGGGVVQEVALSADTRLLENARLPLSVLEDCVCSLPRCKNRARVLNDLREVSGVTDDAPVPVSYLVNTLLFHGATGGSAGIWLARWLTDHAIDASASGVGGGEEWLVVFNPGVIQGVLPRPVSTLEGAQDVPVFRDQKSALAKAAVLPAEALEETDPQKRPGKIHP